VLATCEELLLLVGEHALEVEGIAPVGIAVTGTAAAAAAGVQAATVATATVAANAAVFWVERVTARVCVQRVATDAIAAATTTGAAAAVTAAAWL
jgi:hypothetical protein